MSGGANNTASYFAATVSGGIDNTADFEAATVGGGRRNIASREYATVGGGVVNSASGINATVSGGAGNTASGGSTAVGGGSFNSVSGDYATVAGGQSNTAGDFFGTVGGGWGNESSGLYATIPGGLGNTATNYAFAAGQRAKAIQAGSFVWGDSTEADIASTNVNSVTMRASGGYWLFTDASATTGAFLEAGSGSWTSMSDRNAKENFRAADAREVLEKVVALPVQTWNYGSQDARIRHIGPMAQDFQAAFGVGETDTGIATVDADGVALAAIQGLDEKVEVKGQKSEIRTQKLEAENAELKRRLAELERVVQKLGMLETQP